MTPKKLYFESKILQTNLGKRKKHELHEKQPFCGRSYRPLWSSVFASSKAALIPGGGSRIPLLAENSHENQNLYM